MSEFPECLQIVIAEVDAAVEAELNRGTTRGGSAQEADEN